MPELQKVQQSFRRSLRTYNEHAFVQLEIAQTLAKLLFENLSKQQLQRVFEIGCGTGFFTKALLDKFAVQELHLNDLVGECEVILDEVLREYSESQFQAWRFSAADVNQLDFDGEFDLICSSSSLQWVTDLSALLNKMVNSLSSRAYLAISSFTSGHFHELQTINQQLGSQRQELNYVDLLQWRELLEKQFDLKKIEEQKITLWFDSVEEVLLHLRYTGVNGNTGQHWSQAQLKEFVELFEAEFSQDGRLPLTYAPIFIVAEKL